MTTTQNPRSTKAIIYFLTLLFLSVTAKAQNEISPEQALKQLITGNERFLKGHTLDKHYLTDRPALAEGQHPYAIVLTCADSRLSPEAIFDESLGKLFVIRVAGNVADPVILGSIEYAAEHLHAPLLLVMGHESCGALKAAVSNAVVPPNIAQIIQRLRPAVDKVRVYSRNEAQLLDAAIKENVRYQVKMMTFESDVLSEMEHEHKLKIMGAIYNLHSGKVEFLSEREGEAETEKAVIKAKVEKDPQAKPVATDPHAVPVKANATKAASESAHPDPKHSPIKKAVTHSEKKTGHATADDDEAMLHVLSPLIEPAIKPQVAFSMLPFAEKLRTAYEKDFQLVLKQTTLMRDSKDHCVLPDCRSLAAGEIVKIESPYLLEIMGRPNIRVRSGKQVFYLPAEEQNIAFSNTPAEEKASLITQVLSAPTKLMSALSFASKH